MARTSAFGGGKVGVRNGSDALGLILPLFEATKWSTAIENKKFHTRIIHPSKTSSGPVPRPSQPNAPSNENARGKIARKATLVSSSSSSMDIRSTKASSSSGSARSISLKARSIWYCSTARHALRRGSGAYLAFLVVGSCCTHCWKRLIVRVSLEELK